jgi:hypothetical protein
MGLFGEWVHTGGIDPTVIEIEKGADSEGEVNGVVVPALVMERDHIGGADTGRIAIDFGDEAEKGFVAAVERRGFEVCENGGDKCRVLQ